jgi:phosphate uptake regulator
MERIASHASRMAKVVVGLQAPLPKNLVVKLGSMSEHAAGLVEEALLSLFKRDHAGADVVVEKAKRFSQLEDDLVRSLDEQDIQTYYTINTLVDSQKRIAEYARDIAEVVLDLTIERVVRKETAPYLRAV